MRSKLLLTALLAAALTACGSSPRQGGRTDRSIITAQEIAATRVSTAYEAVERLRPEFLRGRGPFSVSDPNAGLPVVYLDGVRYGEINLLRNISAMNVQTIEFISASDASTRWGTGHAGGVLAVRTKT
jgi:hypothetical protein